MSRMLPRHWTFRPNYQEVQQEDGNCMKNPEETSPRSGPKSFFSYKLLWHATLISSVVGICLLFTTQQVGAKQSLLQSDKVYPDC